MQMFAEKLRTSQHSLPAQGRQRRHHPQQQQHQRRQRLNEVSDGDGAITTR
jgi:hypothetical protein